MNDPTIRHPIHTDILYTELRGIPVSVLWSYYCGEPVDMAHGTFQIAPDSLEIDRVLDRQAKPVHTSRDEERRIAREIWDLVSKTRPQDQEQRP